MSKWLFGVWCLLTLAALPSMAEEENSYIGERECYGCHKNYKNTYLASAHGKAMANNPRNELQAKGCEGCHGPGGKHAKVAGDENYKGSLFIKKFSEPEASHDINKTCLSCHKGEQVLLWAGGPHDQAAVACTSCHTLHTSGPTATADECGTCHVQQRAKQQRSSHMPLREKSMSCLSCHNPHGGRGPSALKQATTTEVCVECHAEKRGPFVWEHAPVRDDCGNCHDPHGSNNPAMLNARAPYLCQECHATALFAGHNNKLYDGSQRNDLKENRAPAATDNLQAAMVGKSCVNCHSQIHGSNHPSGSRFQR